MESTDRKIKDIVIKQYEINFDKNKLRTFEIVNNRLSIEYPNGQIAYYENKLFKLKESAVDESNDYYLRNWIVQGCFQISTKEGFAHLIKYLKVKFVDWLELSCIGFEYYIKKDISEIINNILKEIERIVEAFYLSVSKIRNIQGIIYDLKNPNIDTNGLTLWDLFIDKDKGEQVKQKLIQANHLKYDTEQNLTFIHSGKQIKSEPSSLYYALKCLDYLKKIELTNAKIEKMLSNTLHGFTCGEQAIAKGRQHKNVNYFQTLCNLN